MKEFFRVYYQVGVKFRCLKEEYTFSMNRLQAERGEVYSMDTGCIPPRHSFFNKTSK